MSHADEVITDVNRRRVLARAHEDRFTIAWDYPGRTLLEVRILRSSDRPAGSADDDQDQELVYQDVTGCFRDMGPRSDRPSFYTVFARHPQGEWVRWGEYTVLPEPDGVPGEGGRRVVEGRGDAPVDRSRTAPQGMPGRGGGSRPGLLVLCLLLGVAALALLPAAAGASGGGTSGAGKVVAKNTGAEAANTAARADPSVAAVLEGTVATVESTPWTGADGKLAGYTLQYRWPATQAKAVDEQWPLLRSDATPPKPPYDAAEYRIRASDVTGLRVDVLLDGPAVIQVMPANGGTDYVLQEQTWAPFSWVPWFTARPWIVAPVFILLAILLMLRAWLRSRAWNRRLPSMTRHDRQFISRVAVLLFLLAGFAWQFYEGWYAATGPTVDSGASAAGSLASLPLLLIPPGLFIAGLILELVASPHRGSWALLAVLGGAASAYFLASAVTGATTNLNLTYYILLAVLALIAIPRAFSAGKMGWSRSSSPRYG